MGIIICILIAVILTALFIWQFRKLSFRKQELNDKLTSLYTNEINDSDNGGDLI